MQADLGELFAPRGFVSLKFGPSLGAQPLPSPLLPNAGLAVLQQGADPVGQLPRFSQINRLLPAVFPVSQAEIRSQLPAAVRPPSLDDAALLRQQGPVAKHKLADDLVLPLSFLVNKISILQSYSPSADSDSPAGCSMG